MNDDLVLRKATSTDGVETRANANRQFGDADFDGWVHSWLDELPAARVLDLCCGTGNQLVLYGSRPDCRELTGVDISTESLEVARRRLLEIGGNVNVELHGLSIDDSFEPNPINDTTFDLISCFYGLYYAASAARVIAGAASRLAPGGVIAVVGPYGRNNASLFDLLGRHLDLPELVVRSATTFMEHEVLPELEQHLNVRQETFVNRVHYPSQDAVMEYWRASTFHDVTCEAAVATDIEAHFQQNEKFTVEKHVMAVIGEKSI